MNLPPEAKPLLGFGEEVGRVFNIGKSGNLLCSRSPRTLAVNKTGLAKIKTHRMCLATAYASSDASVGWVAPF